MHERPIVLRVHASSGRTLGSVDIRLFLGAGSVLLLMTTGTAVAAPAQAASAASAASSVAPTRSRPVKRPLTNAELRDSATFPGDLRPADMPPPQVTVPLGRKPPPPSPAEASEAARDAAMPGKIDDRVARCKGLADARQREACSRSVAASDAQGR
jgi:hypothetical protein